MNLRIQGVPGLVFGTLCMNLLLNVHKDDNLFLFRSLLLTNDSLLLVPCCVMCSQPKCSLNDGKNTSHEYKTITLFN